MLLIISQSKDFKLKVELTEALNLNKFVLEYIYEFKNLYSLDTVITRKDLVIEKMKASELNLLKCDEIIVSYIISNLLQKIL